MAVFEFWAQARKRKKAAAERGGPRSSCRPFDFVPLAALLLASFASHSLQYIKKRVPSGLERCNEIDESTESRRESLSPPLFFATTNVFNQAFFPLFLFQFTHLALLVSDHDDGPERQLLASRADLGHARDLDDALLELGRLGRPVAAPATAAVTAAPPAAAAASAAPTAPAAAPSGGDDAVGLVGGGIDDLGRGGASDDGGEASIVAVEIAQERCRRGSRRRRRCRRPGGGRRRPRGGQAHAGRQDDARHLVFAGTKS